MKILWDHYDTDFRPLNDDFEDSKSKEIYNEKFKNFIADINELLKYNNYLNKKEMEVNSKK